MTTQRALLRKEARAWRQIAGWFLAGPVERHSFNGLCYAIRCLPVAGYKDWRLLLHMSARLQMHLEAFGQGLGCYAFPTNAENRPVRAMCALLLALECEDEAKAL